MQFDFYRQHFANSSNLEKTRKKGITEAKANYIETGGEAEYEQQNLGLEEGQWGQSDIRDGESLFGWRSEISLES